MTHAEPASNRQYPVRHQGQPQPEPPSPGSVYPFPPAMPSAFSDVATPLEDFNLDALPPIRRWTRWGGLAIAASVGIATALATFTPYRVVIQTEAMIRPAGELKQIEATAAGTVVEIIASENQSVQAGEVIARIDDAPLQTQRSQLQTSIEQAELQLQQVNAQLQTQDRRIQAERDRTQRLINSTHAELRQAQRIHHDQQIVSAAEVEEVKAQLRSEQAGLEAARLQVQRYEPLAATGAISQEQLDEARLAVQQQEETIAATQARLQRVMAGLNPSDAEVMIARERIAQEHASSDAALAALAQEREVLIQQSVEIQQQQIQDQHELNQVNQNLQQTIIRAPVTGTLFQLNLRNPGQTVAIGDNIARIAPDESGLTVQALVSTTEIHQLEVGQPAQLRISACPYPDYGTLPGIVQTISPDAVNAQPIGATIVPSATHSATSLGGQSRNFKVSIQPDQLTFGQHNHQCSLQPGMTGRADIITNEETVLTFLLRKTKLLANL